MEKLLTILCLLCFSLTTHTYLSLSLKNSLAGCAHQLIKAEQEQTKLTTESDTQGIWSEADPRVGQRGPWPHLNFYMLLYLDLDIHQNKKTFI